MKVLAASSNNRFARAAIERSSASVTLPSTYKGGIPRIAGISVGRIELPF